MLKYLLLTVILVGIITASAQDAIRISVKNSTLAATDSLLPFWFSANQHGKIKTTGSFLNVSDLFIGQDYVAGTDSTIAFTWGGNLVAALRKNNYYQLNRAFAGLSYKGWELKGGLFYDPVRYGGLSTSNGNIARSQNARPYPMLRFSTMGYKPVPILQKWFSFKAEYDEGILNDKRYVENARMHHKSLYLRVQLTDYWVIQGGMEHFVMWGGTSQNKLIGRLPSGLNAYWRYVLGRSGDESFPETEQINVAGNQLGTYELAVVKHFQGLDATFYLSHPFEDHSGKNLRNWPDNLLGLHFSFHNKNTLITDLVYEFTDTRQQSILDSIYGWNETTGQWVRLEYDNYFNHGLYNSGYTYHQQVMASPLFFPVVLRDGIARGLRSNRFIAQHLGLRGNLSEYLRWKGMLTWIEHLGTYGIFYIPTQKQVSGLLELEYVNPGFPVELGLSVGADSGITLNNNFGLQFWIAKRW